MQQNFSRRLSGIEGLNWRKVLSIGIAVIVLCYVYGRPQIEGWLDSGPPPAATQATGEQSGEQSGVGPDAARRPPESSPVQPDIYRDFFRQTGRDEYTSPAGLVYSMGPAGEHRIQHVLRHSVDMPNRPVHSVFKGQDHEIFATIDEAFQLIGEQSPQVKTVERDGVRQVYVVSIGRPIGFEGGEKGKRNGHPSLGNLKLVLQSGNRVITAYPHR